MDLSNSWVEISLITGSIHKLIWWFQGKLLVNREKECPTGDTIKVIKIDDLA